MLRIEKWMKRKLISVRSDETAFGACVLMRVLNIGSMFVKERDTIIGINQDRPLFEAADMMQQHGTRHLAVTQENEIVGVVSVRDMLHPVAVDDCMCSVIR